MDKVKRRRFWDANLQGNLFAGILTITPLVVVRFVFDFLLNALSEAGRPLAESLTDFVDRTWPAATPLLASGAVRWFIAVLVALLVLYAIGATASRVAGQQLLAMAERLIAPPGGGQRVVLIDFPQPGMKTLAFVMRSFPDSVSGELLASVYVPTALNPTSGYLEIVPWSTLVPTDISPDQAMTMIISCGAVMPDRLTLTPSGPAK
jgi:uncharacterized membrane protein